MTTARAVRALFAACCALLAAACAHPVVKPAAGGTTTAAAPVMVWTSSSDGERRLARGADIALVAAGATSVAGEPVLRVDPAKGYQRMVGFGAAMTDASAILFQQVLARPARDRLFAELFGRGHDGLGLSFLRVPIGASDFSTSRYSLDDMPAGQSDPALAHFSMAGPDAAQVPALIAARRVNPALTLLATPWSAPGWMKDSRSVIGGHLRADAYAPFAEYLSRYLAAMDRRGLPVALLTIQNEPGFAPTDYPGMPFDAAGRARFDGQFLGPLLAAQGQATRILEWDHNWDAPQEPLAVLGDPQAARYVGGVAWHCYGGNVSAMEQVRAAHPDKDAFVTECSGGEWAPDWGGTLGWMTDNLLIAPARYGSRGTVLWNLALDEAHGPHLGGCGDCRGVVTIDRKSGAVTRNVEYYVLGQVSRFVAPGAQRIESGEAGELADVAFRNPDGSLVLLVHNRSAARLAFTVLAGENAFRAELPAGEVATYVWGEHPKDL